MRDYRFHCEDCDSYSQCQYYHNRKGTSLICKEFQYGSSVIEQIRAEIEYMRNKVKPLDDFSDRGMYADGKIAAYDYVLQIIDKYTKGESE